MISVVVGGEVGLLRSIEEGCGVIIDEMPIHVSATTLVFVQFSDYFCSCRFNHVLCTGAIYKALFLL